MLPSLLLSLTVGLTLALGASARPSSYAVWAADSAIARKQGTGLANGQPKADYTHGTLWFALRRLYEKTGNSSYAEYVKAGADNVVSSNGTVQSFKCVLCLQHLCMVQELLMMMVLKVIRASARPDSHWACVHLAVSLSRRVLRSSAGCACRSGRLGQAKYVYAARQFMAALDVQPRTPAGQYWHKQAYPNQGWLDGAYMGYVFYANYMQTWYPYNNTAWSKLVISRSPAYSILTTVFITDDISKQYSLLYSNTLVTSGTYQGLLYHGYDASKSTVWASSDRGHSPEVWDRAVGWYVMALVDTIDILGEASAEDDTPLRVAAVLKAQLAALAPAVVRAADPTTGVWWLVMTQPGREGNYFESSGAAMFIYGFLRAVRKGYIADADGSIVKAMKKAYDYAIKNWVVAKSDGTMDWMNTVSVRVFPLLDFPAYIVVLGWEPEQER